MRRKQAVYRVRIVVGHAAVGVTHMSKNKDQAMEVINVYDPDLSPL